MSRASELDVIAMMEHLGRDSHAGATAVLVDTGLRLGELRRVRHEDISGRHLTVWESKGNTSRTVPLTSRAHRILTSVVAGAPGGPFNVSAGWYRTVWDRVRDTMGQADNPQWVPHMLRHTCASRLVQGGMDIRHVQAWMGHASITMTMRYAHLAPKSLEHGVSILEEAGA
jgi:integrase